MDLNTQILFLFSALGALNGLFLSVYFAFFSEQKQVSNYFLSALLFVLSIRILKSVFMYFNPGLSEVFIQIGLSACALIGPFLYLYIGSLTSRNNNTRWILHIFPALAVITVIGTFYSYWDYKIVWSKYIVKLIYLQWLVYIVLSGIKLKSVFKRLFVKKEKLRDLEIWTLSIFSGIAIIWLGYNIGSYTSYIVGALSFSFVLYLLILFWVFKRRKNSLFFEDKEKYASKRIEDKEAKEFLNQLEQLMITKTLYKNRDIKLKSLADTLNVSTHYLSQLLNNNLGKSFSQYINGLRVEESKRLIEDNDQFTLEAIGIEAGFSSKSTFYSTFKKLTRITPAEYKKQIS